MNARHEQMQRNEWGSTILVFPDRLLRSRDPALPTAHLAVCGEMYSRGCRPRMGVLLANGDMDQGPVRRCYI